MFNEIEIFFPDNVNNKEKGVCSDIILYSTEFIMRHTARSSCYNAMVPAIRGRNG